MRFFQLTTVKMPTIVGIVTFTTKQNDIITLAESEKKRILDISLDILYLAAFKISCPTELSTKMFYSIGTVYPVWLANNLMQ